MGYNIHMCINQILSYRIFRYMSCGNRFSCGIKRFDKHATSIPDKPTNQELYNSNNKKLDELLFIRSQQDKGIFEPLTQFPYQQNTTIDQHNKTLFNHDKTF